jgi:hypothetical protein
LTQAGLIRVIKTWKKRLALDHIDIDVDLVKAPENEEALASVSPHQMYDQAVMQFSGKWPEWNDFEVNRVVVHELLHILFRDYNNAVGSISQAGVLSYQVQALWNDRLEDAEEALIDRIAHRLVEVGGVVT